MTEKPSYQYVNDKTKKIDEKIGDLSELETADKSSVVEAVNELFTSVGDGKTVVAAAITDKGVQTSADATFQQMSNNIGAIQTGITPSGTKDITANGNGIDVAQFAAVNVNVPSDAPTDQALTVSQNGEINTPSGVRYNPITVNVPIPTLPNVRTFLWSNSTLRTSATTAVTDNADVAAHYADADAFAIAFPVGELTFTGGRCLMFALNKRIRSGSFYSGYADIAGSSIYSGSGKLMDTGEIRANSNGDILLNASGSYVIRPSTTWLIVFGWN